MGDDGALFINELIAVICEAMEKKAHICHLPKGLINVNAKIKAALGITQMPVRAKDGLMETIRVLGNKDLL